MLNTVESGGRRRGLREVAHRIRVLIADDHAMVREGIAEMLSLDDGIEVVGQAENGREAVELARETRPDVVILDVEMPVMGAQGALRRLLGISSPMPKVIIVTVFADQRLVRELLGLGASAFLTKGASSQDLTATVRTAARDLHEGNDNVTVIVPRKDFDAEESAESELSRREAQILRLVANGMGNKEVANTIHLSETTVKRHLSNVYDKLDVSTRGEAVSRAFSEGWISSSDLTSEE